MSENGSFIDLKGNSSDIIVNEALKFIEEKSKENLPFFTVIWDGSPHDPFLASAEDRKTFMHLDEPSQNHYGELVAFDRSLGLLRKKLRELNLADNTLIWYCSDNGGLSKIKPNTVGGLRGSKGTIYEGGLRVPGIIEWPAVIEPKVSRYPASTMDIFPTIVDILGLPKDNMLNPIDGISLRPILKNEVGERNKKIPFRYQDQGVLLDNNYKLIATSVKESEFVLYNLESDPLESQNISKEKPVLFEQMKMEFIKWNQTVESSMLGKDYPEGKVLENPKSHFWMKDDRYHPFLEEWSKRPEYRDRILRGK
jgi:arylsulfatase A-like enzyme